MSALFHAGRHEELLALLNKAPTSLWHYREWGVKALAAMGRKAEAIRYAEASRALNDNPIAIARACEEILLASGLAEEAYTRCAIAANQRTTFLATFRAIARKYPTQVPAKVLDDLVASTPGQEGKWFAAAKDAGHPPPDPARLPGNAGLLRAICERSAHCGECLSSVAAARRAAVATVRRGRSLPTVSRALLAAVQGDAGVQFPVAEDSVNIPATASERPNTTAPPPSGSRTGSSTRHAAF